MTKVKIAAAVSLAVAVAAAGLGTWSHTTWAAAEPAAPQPATKGGQGNEQQAMMKLGKQLNTEWARGAKLQDNIAWGEKVHGLQAGIAFRRGDQETYEVGQSVTFVVYLRNVSDKKINLSHIDPVFDEWMPVVRDSEGRRLAVAPGPIHLGRVPVVQRSLEAGRQIILGYPWFRIRPLGWRGKVLGPTCCAEPGRYKVRYNGFLRLDDGKDISLGTKQIELDIRKREAAKADGADNKAPIVEKPAISPIADAETTPLYYFLSRSIRIPIQIDPKRRDSIQKLILCVSGDQGQTWEQVDKKPSTGNSFIFQASGDGTYWFVVQEVDKQERCVPPDPSRVKPMIRVCVDTTPPVVALQGQCDKNTISLTWTAEDANLEDKSVRQIQFALHKDGPWSDPIISGPLPNTGHHTWSWASLHVDNIPSDLFWRLRVRDKAGNDGYAVAYVKLKEDKPSQESHQRGKSKNKEHEEARRFIDRVWPTFKLEQLGGKVSEARQAFQKCKEVGDIPSIRKLIKGTEGHVDRLRKRLAELRPDLIIDDEKEAQKYKKVGEEISKLGEDVQEYLKTHADDK